MSLGLFAFATFVFLLPHLRTRRNFAPAVCTVTAAVPACSLECRTANVTSPSFPRNATAAIALSGIGSAPCQTAAACGEETFACRFRVDDSTRAISVRRDRGTLSLGFVVFTALGLVVLAGLAFWLIGSACGAVGTASGPKVRAVIFLAPGLELSEITRVARWRWPNLDVRGLDFDCVAGERADQFFVTVRRVFGTPERAGKRGVVFAVKANAHSDAQVLKAVPRSWFRVAVLPALDVCLAGIAGDDAQVGEVLAEEAEEGMGSPKMVSSLGGTVGVGAGFRQRNKLLEAETTYRELARLCSVEEGNFDFVYSAVEAASVAKKYDQIVCEAFGPVVGRRTTLLAAGIRAHRALDRFGSFMLNGILACNWHSDPRERKRAGSSGDSENGEKEQRSFSRQNSSHSLSAESALEPQVLREQKQG